MKIKNIQQIEGRVQHYAWGGDHSCIVSQLSNQLEDEPFAEIWYGSHKRLPSLIYGTEEPLKVNLHFLLKFLSISKPLSIQIHPTKEIAEKLFQEDPVHYVDPNAKPELCIPLTEFHCFLGYLDNDLLKQQMNDNPPVKKYLEWNGSNDIYSMIMKAHSLSKTEIRQYIHEMNEFLYQKRENHEELSRHQLLFDNLYENFGDDCGLLISFLLRYEIFQPYEGFFITPNHPHGYISGECIEAMISSDNVIRFGLTPKFCDLHALKYIDHQQHQHQIKEVEKNIIRFTKDDNIQTSQCVTFINPSKYANDFHISIYTINKNCTLDMEMLHISLFVLYKGKIEIDDEMYDMASSFLIQPKTCVKIKAIEEAFIVVLN